jgi:hypothetical protein
VIAGPAASEDPRPLVLGSYRPEPFRCDLDDHDTTERRGLGRRWLECRLCGDEKNLNATGVTP